MRVDLVRGSLDLLLLDVLHRHPSHGYAVIERLRSLSEGVFDLPEGTVYPALHRLEASGLLSSTWDVVDGRRRRVYAVTEQGVAARADRQEQWTSFATGVGRILGRA